MIFMNHCRAIVRTLPMLQDDPSNIEDLDSDAEDRRSYTHMVISYQGYSAFPSTKAWQRLGEGNLEAAIEWQEEKPPASPASPNPTKLIDLNEGE